MEDPRELREGIDEYFGTQERLESADLVGSRNQASVEILADSQRSCDVLNLRDRGAPLMFEKA
jgi:hypothetical protein